MPSKATNSAREQQTQILSVGSSQAKQGSSHCNQPLGLSCSSDFNYWRICFRVLPASPSKAQEDADSPVPGEPAAARGHTRLAREVVLQSPLRARQGAPSPRQGFPLVPNNTGRRDDFSSHRSCTKSRRLQAAQIKHITARTV